MSAADKVLTREELAEAMRPIAVIIDATEALALRLDRLQDSQLMASAWLMKARAARDAIPRLLAHAEALDAENAKLLDTLKVRRGRKPLEATDGR